MLSNALILLICLVGIDCMVLNDYLRKLALFKALLVDAKKFLARISPWEFSREDACLLAFTLIEKWAIHLCCNQWKDDIEDFTNTFFWILPLVEFNSVATYSSLCINNFNVVSLPFCRAGMRVMWFWKLVCLKEYVSSGSQTKKGIQE